MRSLPDFVREYPRAPGEAQPGDLQVFADGPLAEAFLGDEGLVATAVLPTSAYPTEFKIELV